MTEIKNIRDLLIHTIGPEMGRARDSGLMRRRYLNPDLGYDEAIVAWVLDAMSVLSLEKMIEYRREHGFPGADPQP
jgi:hypothetical protein